MAQFTLYLKTLDASLACQSIVGGVPTGSKRQSVIVRSDFLSEIFGTRRIFLEKTSQKLWWRRNRVKYPVTIFTGGGLGGGKWGGGLGECGGGGDDGGDGGCSGLIERRG